MHEGAVHTEAPPVFPVDRTRGGKPNIARCGMNGSARVKERELVYDISGIAELGVASFPMVAAQAAKPKSPCHPLLS